MTSPSPARWPPLLLALRRSTRPDHARVAAFIGFARRPGGWTDYREFLAIHRGWIDALDVDALAGVPPEEHDAVVASAHTLFRRWEEWLSSPQARVAQFQASSGVYDYS